MRTQAKNWAKMRQEKFSSNVRWFLMVTSRTQKLTRPVSLKMDGIKQVKAYTCFFFGNSNEGCTIYKSAKLNQVLEKPI